MELALAGGGVAVLALGAWLVTQRARLSAKSPVAILLVGVALVLVGIVFLVRSYGSAIDPVEQSIDGSTGLPYSGPTTTPMVAPTGT